MIGMMRVPLTRNFEKFFLKASTTDHQQAPALALLIVLPNRFKVELARLGEREHSQIRNTLHPFFRRALFTFRSRSTLLLSFAFQNALRDFGRRLWRGHPCQKQPSTNTATCSLRNMKSGFPIKRALRRQPMIWCWRNRAIRRISVESLPRPRTRDIRSDRSVGLRVSIQG